MEQKFGASTGANSFQAIVFNPNVTPSEFYSVGHADSNNLQFSETTQDYLLL